MSSVEATGGCGQQVILKAADRGQYRNWAITVPYYYDKAQPEKYYTHEEVEAKLHKIGVTKYCFQLEVGGATGYIHYQTVFQASNKKGIRMSTIQKHFGKIHCESVKSEEACYEYCSKEDTRMAGPWIYPRPIKDPMEGLELKYWQHCILEILKREPNSRTIYWFWEKVGNVGKTTFCKHLCIKKKAICVAGKKDNILHAVKETSPEIIVIDIARNQKDISYDAIEAVKNGIFFSGKYESGMHIQNIPHIFIFANWPPDKEKLSADRWNVHEIGTEFFRMCIE